MPGKQNIILNIGFILAIILVSFAVCAHPVELKNKKNIQVDFPLDIHTQQDGDVELVWESLPYDSCVYIIERSLDLSTGFVAIGEVQGRKKRYTQLRFQDHHPAQGTVYYRVKRKLPNQKFEVSGVQYVTLFYTTPRQPKQDHPYLQKPGG